MKKQQYILIVTVLIASIVVFSWMLWVENRTFFQTAEAPHLSTGVTIDSLSESKSKDATKTAIREFLPAEESNTIISYDYSKQDVVVQFCDDQTTAETVFLHFLADRGLNAQTLNPNDLRYEHKESCPFQ